MNNTTGKIPEILSVEEREHLFNEAERIARIGHWKWSEGGEYMTYCSEQVAHIFGLSVNDMLSPPKTHSDYLQLVVPEDREKVNKAVEDYSRLYDDESVDLENIKMDVDYRILRADGAVRHVRERSEAVLDENGRRARAVATIQDVTEQKHLDHVARQAQEHLEKLVEQRTRELQESEEQFRHAAQSATLCHWRTDADFINWTHTSDNTIDMLGVDPEEMFGPMQVLYMNYIHPDDQARVSVVYEENHHNKTAYDVVYRWCRPDGEIRQLWEMGEPVFDDGGKITEWLGTTQDVTPLKQAEDAMMQAKLEAEMANRAKSEMLATMSHELRTPLNAIIGFSQVFLGEIYGPLGNARYHEYAADIIRSGEHLLELISDILDVSAIETGELELFENELDLPRQVKNMLRLVEHRARQGIVTLVNDVPDDLPRLYADERRVNQILLNLLSNAVKFTDEGGTVSIDAHQQDNGALSVTVKDSGIGMSESDLAKALTPFGQVDRGITGKHEGSGLGLPLTKSLVELHGGELDIESTPGKGTVINVSFPVERTLN